MGQLRQPQCPTRRRQGGVTMNSFAGLLAQCLKRRVQAVVDGMVVEFGIGHRPEGIQQWQ